MLLIATAPAAAVAVKSHNEYFAVTNKSFQCLQACLQDAEAGRGLEVAPYVTAVQEVAKYARVATPTLNVIAALVGHYDSNLRRMSCAPG